MRNWWYKKKKECRLDSCHWPPNTCLAWNRERMPEKRRTVIKKSRKNDDSLWMTWVSSKISGNFIENENRFKGCCFSLSKRREKRTRCLYKSLVLSGEKRKMVILTFCFGIWIKNCNYYFLSVCKKIVVLNIS